MGKITFQITTSVGRSLQTYDLRRGLQLVFLSHPQCPETITATYAYRDRVLVAWGGNSGQDQGVWIFKRGKRIGQLEETEIRQDIKDIVVFGRWIVASGSKAIEVWDSTTHEHYTTILPSTGSTFTGRITTMPTYLNKVFVGCSNGNVEIYNISTAKLVHTIHTPSASAGSVTAMAPAMALSVLAVAYHDGALHIYNVDTDETIISINSKSGNAITSISFRSDGIGAGEDGRKDGVMATASIESGDITLWDLNRGGRVAAVLRGAHEVSPSSKTSGITRIDFLGGQAVMVSSGLDNALRTWVYDATPFSPMPRMLHSRSGHGGSVTELMFLPAASDGSEAAGKWLLSAGGDNSLWTFSLRKDGQNTELSQGNVKSKSKKAGQVSDDRTAVEDFKASPIIDMACSLNRDGGMGAVSGKVWSNERKATAEESSMTGWESIVTAHENDKYARTWSYGRRKAGRWTFESGDKQPVTSVAITACGTFALVGSAGGALDMFNLQSGLHRQRFPPRLKPAEAKELQNNPDAAEKILSARRGRKAAITGIVVDDLNQTVVSSALDGTIAFHSFSSGLLESRLVLPSNTSALRLRYSPTSSLLAAPCDDLCIRIIDVPSRRIVRELWGCVGPISSLAFSNDGRWIVSASLDSVVRVFDLSTGLLIDAFRLAPTVTNVAFNPTGEYLATTHAGTLGIQLWTNKSLFTTIAPQPISEESGIIDLTSSTSTLTPLSALTTTDLPTPPPSPTPTSSTLDQLSSSLLTLSLLPRSRWTTLLNLDTIRQRNKPIAPPTKPTAAPFFLGSSLALSQPTSTSNTTTAANKFAASTALSRITPSTLTTADTDITSLLTLPTPKDSTHPLLTHLLALPPSTTALTLRTLPLSQLPTFINVLTSHIRLRRDYEIVNTYISLILKYHSEFCAVPEVAEALRAWAEVNDEEGRRLGEMVGLASGVLGGWLRSAR